MTTLGKVPDSKCLYADGSTMVRADDKSVSFGQDGAVVIVSHATMREIVLSWERHEERETE